MIIFAIALTFVCLVVAYTLFKNATNRKNYPPGPTPLPIIGNIHQIDLVKMHLTFDEWYKKYGDLVYARLMSKPLIVLNTFDVAKEALVRQGDNFAARPELYIVAKITGGKGYIRSDGPLWKDQRRHGLHALRDFGHGRSMQEEKIMDETPELFASLEKDAQVNDGVKSTLVDPIADLKFAVVNIINNILFGKRFPYGDSEFLQFQKMISENLYDINRQFPMEFVHILRWFPSLFNQQECVRKYQFLKKYYEQEIKHHQETLDEDLANGSPSDFTYAYLQEMKKRKSESQETTSFSEHQLVQNVSDLFIAGFETTASTLSWYFAYMAHYPEIQERMREEIHKNMGTVPSWADRVKLPYTSAVIAETQRHANIVPFGVFHSLYDDTTINGYHVPKQSMVIVNHWSIMRNKKQFPNPEKFYPDRFLADDGSFSEKIEGFIPFSIGKRACMGESLARMELFLFATALVLRYRITPSPDGPPSMEPVSQFTLAPQPFKVSLEVIG